MAQPYIGEIRMFAGTFAPLGWEYCNGQPLPIAENEALYQLIGTTYGGDGQESFNLPNLQSRVPLHFGTGPDTINYPISQQAGTESVTLTTQQIPSHTHPLTASTTTGTDTTPGGRVLAQTPGGIKPYLAQDADVNMSPQAITPVGGSQPHENCQPFLCINYIISLFGIFPSPT
ncbi:MAG TPA: tail fiber protein [Longimicrobium sp.]|jgi:microcystin-dependent protein